jgi:hypothetical protein
MHSSMTMKAFIPFSRKPAKSPGAAVAKAFGLSDIGGGAEWALADSKFRVRLEDFREDLEPDNRDWADEVGWHFNWAVSVAVNDKGRTDEDYALWHALTAVIMKAYGTQSVWTDAGLDSPIERMKLTTFLPGFVSEEADDLNPDGFDEEDEPLPEPSPEPQKRVSFDMLNAARSDIEPARAPAPAPEAAPARGGLGGMMPVDTPPGEDIIARIRAELRAEYESRNAAPEAAVESKPELVPLDEDEDEFGDYDDWDDDEDESSTDSDGAITDW